MRAMSVGAVLVESVAAPLYGALRSLVVLLLRPSWYQNVEPVCMVQPASVDGGSSSTGDCQSTNFSAVEEPPHDQNDKNEVIDSHQNDESEPKVQVNLNKKKKIGKLVAPPQDSSEDAVSNGGDRATIDDEKLGDSKIEEAVKFSASPIKNKERREGKQFFDVSIASSNSKRCRRSSECLIGSTYDTKKFSGRDGETFATRPKSILKRRGRSYSESHIGSLEECLGEELLGKYGSVEEALVGEYGCLESLLEECGWGEDGDDGAFFKSDDLESSEGSKKSVRFSETSQTHLFMSKASILNQLANDDKKAMRQKMKDLKKKQRSEKRSAHKSGSSPGSPRRSFDSSYRSNGGYSSHDEGVTTEESDGCELLSSSCETTDNTTTEEDTDTEKEPPAKTTIMEKSVYLSCIKKNQNFGAGRKRGRKCNKKRVELTNNMIFQLDMEA
ncbi:uncharacterized protein LOC108675947 isoform X2 [Hyalella azteca]|uniref:Uncharacterized protein LOC108675947 isoform X2 n=1 Tax=Hyalella azteca TaxID=294128 RepID=A0A8B7P0F5_HYAAZ|nr:uncharacterized protein LOC108675947 isoform X2 [Hyalella azteca]